LFLQHLQNNLFFCSIASPFFFYINIFKIYFEVAMKKSLFFLLALSLISLLAINSCNDKGNVISVNNSADKTFSNMVFPNYDDIIGEQVSGGTIEEGFSIILFKNNSTSSKSKESKIQCGDKNGGHNGDKDDDHDGENEDDHDGCAYGTILHQLDLSKDQKDQIFQFKKNFHDCVDAARDNYQTQKGIVLHDANQQRKDIIKQWKDGTITKDEAKTLLENLETATEQQIKDLKTAFQAAVGDCLCTFLKNIVSVLDPTQKETFITWVENNKCINVNCYLRQGPPAN
jgi:hypothetical protein